MTLRQTKLARRVSPKGFLCLLWEYRTFVVFYFLTQLVSVLFSMDYGWRQKPSKQANTRWGFGAKSAHRDKQSWFLLCCPQALAMDEEKA